MVCLGNVKHLLLPRHLRFELLAAGGELVVVRSQQAVVVLKIAHAPGMLRERLVLSHELCDGLLRLER